MKCCISWISFSSPSDTVPYIPMENLGPTENGTDANAEGGRGGYCRPYHHHHQAIKQELQKNSTGDMPSLWWHKAGITALTAGLFVAFPAGVTCLKFWWLGALLVPEPYTFLVPLSLLVIAAALIVLACRLFSLYDQKMETAIRLLSRSTGPVGETEV